MRTLWDRCLDGHRHILTARVLACLNIVNKLLVTNDKVSSSQSVKLSPSNSSPGCIPSCERFAASGTREWLLLGMCPLVALNMFEAMENIRTKSALESLGLPLAVLSRSSMLYPHRGMSCGAIHLLPWP